MQIWRMETESGEGPYSLKSRDSSAMREALGGDRSSCLSDAQRPTPCSDAGLGIAIEKATRRGIWDLDWDYWFFGFVDLDQYFSWVPDLNIRTRLREEGIRLVCFEVENDHCYIGDSQVMFRKALAKPLRVLDCDFDPAEEQKELAAAEKVA